MDEEHGSTPTEMGKKERQSCTKMHKAMSQTTKGCSCWSRGWGVLRRRGHHRGEPGIEGSLARVEWGWTASHMAGRAPSVVRGHPADTWVGPPRGPGSMAGPCFPRVRRTWQRSGMPPAANPPTSGQHRQWQPSISLQGQTPPKNHPTVEEKDTQPKTGRSHT